MKKKNYAAMFTLRKDGLYMGFWHEKATSGRKGKRHAVYDKDPERLFFRIQEKENEIPPSLTFESAACAWERTHWSRIGQNTADAYSAPLRRITDQFSGYNAEDVTAQQIQAFLFSLAKHGYSRRSVQMHRDIMNMIFNNAIIEFGLRFNPCSAVALPKSLPVEKRTIPPDVAIAAIKEGASLPFGMFALVCLYAGLRRGEALALTYEDIDRKTKMIRVEKAVEFIGNNPHIKPPKTAAGVRDVPLLPPLAAALPEDGKGLLFPRDDGGLLTKTQYRKRWEKYCDAIGYKVTAHQLRHEYATMLYEAGIADKDAQELLGHSNILVTRNIYTHIRSRQKAEAAQKLASYIAQKPV